MYKSSHKISKTGEENITKKAHRLCSYTSFAGEILSVSKEDGPGARLLLLTAYTIVLASSD